MEYFYDGKKVFSQPVRAPLLLHGVVPAISLHAHMQVEVNMGEAPFTVLNEREHENKELPDGYLAALRSSKMGTSGGTATSDTKTRRRQQGTKGAPRPESQR
eukprot:3868404-Prymnesium_polylepis.1